MLEARHFTIYTDHKPLCFAFNERKQNCTPRQFRHLDYISQFTTDIRHISSRSNIVADTLSRVDEVRQPIDLTDLAEDQLTDSELAEYIESSSLRLEKHVIPGSRIPLYCDVSTPTHRPFITKPFRKKKYSIFYTVSATQDKASSFTLCLARSKKRL